MLVALVGSGGGSVGYVILGVEARECERHLLGQEVEQPQLCSLVGPPGPVGTTGHRTGNVPNACQCGALNLGAWRGGSHQRA